MTVTNTESGPRHHSRVFAAVVALVMSAFLGVSLFAPAAQAQPAVPPQPESLAAMGTPPPGTNDWSCVPSVQHPRPVVLIHGTDTDMQGSWPVLAPELAAQGYCVFALNYGARSVIWDTSKILWGVDDIEKSSVELKQFVDMVLQTTGAAQVDLVGHSQGGTLARQYLKFDGGADPADPALNKVHRVITLGATNHGTSFNGLQQLYLLATSFGLPKTLTSQLVFGIAGAQQLIGSPLLQRLNAGSEVMADVDYTVVATRNDEVVTPPDRTFLNDGGLGRVDNQWVQDLCPSHTVSHMGLTTDPVVAYMVSSALDPAYPESHPLACPAPS